tara:strand:- start:114 stop:560 length:447 start_codon:yes stop_codon:yes gene_type:complete
MQLVAALPSRIPEIQKLIMASLREQTSATIDEDAVNQYVSRMVRDDHQLCVVACVNGKSKGVVIGEVGGHPFAKGLIAEDSFIYVKPAFRTPEAMQDLTECYAFWCMRIPNLIVSTLGTSQLGTAQSVEPAAEREGYTACTTYIKEHS